MAKSLNRNFDHNSEPKEFIFWPDPRIHLRIAQMNLAKVTKYK